MTYIRNTFIAALTALITTSAMAEARVPLPKEEHINASLVSLAVGNIIRKTCPSISARFWTAYSKGRALKSYALRQGYSEAELRKFLKDPDEKKRVKLLAADYLYDQGAVLGDIDSYCRVGRAEIAKKTVTGQMLRAR